MTISEKYRRKILKDNFSIWFRIAIFINLLYFTVERDSLAGQHIVKYYVNRLHPIYLITAIITFPISLMLFGFGVLLWLAMIVETPVKSKPKEIRINMSRRGKGGNKLSKHAAKCYPGMQGIKRTFNFSNLAEEIGEDWLESEEMYQANMSSFAGNNPEGGTSKVVKLSNKTAVVYTGSEEGKKEAKKKLYEEIPEEDIRFANLKKALKEGHISSVERFFKHKCNIYPIDLGYALERVGRDRTHLFLKLDINYVKVWEGENKTELLNTLIKEYYSGKILPVARYKLKKALKVIDFNTNDLAQEDKDLLEQLQDREYKVSTLPEELGVVKREFK